MPFIVRAPTADEVTVITKRTRVGAIKTEVALVAQGIEGVTTIDEDGEAFSPDRFNAFYKAHKRRGRKPSRIIA